MLSTRMISNIRRSNDQSESIDVTIDFDTPPEKIAELTRRMHSFVIEHHRDFINQCDANIQDIENLKRIRLSYSIKYKGNWQQMGLRYRRRNDFMFALVKNIRELEIKYTPD